jgi:hypothetical protein
MNQVGGFAMPVLLARTKLKENLSLSSAFLSPWMETTPLNVFSVENRHLSIQAMEMPQ